MAKIQIQLTVLFLLKDSFKKPEPFFKEKCKHQSLQILSQCSVLINETVCWKCQLAYSLLPSSFFFPHYKLNSLTSLSILLPVSLLADFQPVDYIEAVIKMLNSHSSSALKGSLAEKCDCLYSYILYTFAQEVIKLTQLPGGLLRNLCQEVSCLITNNGRGNQPHGQETLITCIIFFPLSDLTVSKNNRPSLLHPSGNAIIQSMFTDK